MEYIFKFNGIGGERKLLEVMEMVNKFTTKEGKSFENLMHSRLI
jgi:hypothetical protein